VTLPDSYWEKEAEWFIETARNGKYKWTEPRTQNRIASLLCEAYKRGRKEIQDGIRDLLDVPSMEQHYDVQAKAEERG
jgi:hypothetical protein